MTDHKPDNPARRRSSTGPHPPVMSLGNPAIGNHLTSASSYADLQYLFGVQDPAMIVPPKSNRNRRKASQGSEHAKHRRTRSGCYTCRSRRVKCDETHPICERCKKGSRECVYPETSSSSKPSAGTSSKAAATTKPESPSSSDDEHDEKLDSPRLEAIPDEGEIYDDMKQTNNTVDSGGQTRLNSQTSGQDKSNRQNSETPSLVQDKGSSPTPSTEGSVGYSTFSTVVAESTRLSRTNIQSASRDDDLRPEWSHLPQDLQYYLGYFCENITYYHYSLKFDSHDFLRTQFIDAALHHEPLLYAVVGFSAFQRTLRNPAGKIQDFLQYYNKAVSLLLHSLKKGDKHNTGTLLAILQLATIEEFLGDWINLLGHQKAAYQILTELYTPKTVMEENKSRLILGWYMRFDVFVSLMGRFETVLSREWFSYAREFFKQKILEEPNALSWKIESVVAENRLNAMDMSILFAKAGKGEIAPEEFLRENAELARRFQEWDTKMDSALKDPRYVVTDFSGARPLDPDDIVDPYIPNILYTGPLFPMNVARIDWYSIDLMHRYQTALFMRQQPDASLRETAIATCQLFEAVEYYPQSPPGTVLACQASLGIASLFLPKDETHSMWARRKFATVESHGYIYPFTFRTEMSDLFRDRTCMHWWLPNDERYPPIIRSIRKLVEERTAPARNMHAENVRDIKAIFAAMKLEDGKSSVTTGDGTDSGLLVATGHNIVMDQQHVENMSGMESGDTHAYEHGLDKDNFWDQRQSGNA